MYNYKKAGAVLIGNTMQFYDFTIYAFLATQISKQFFNFKSEFLSYLVVFCVFSGGYLTRPIGALIFGHFGDRSGRSKALSITIIFSAFTTFLIGILPGYKTMGLASPIILVILRLMQGLAVSGEEGGSVVLLFEDNSFKNKGILGSMVLSSVLVGVLLGMIVCLETSRLFSDPSFQYWSWRIPFLVSLPLGIIGISLRFLFNDNQLFFLAKKNKLLIQKPVKSLFKTHLWTVLYGVSTVSIYSIMTSTLIVHLPYFFKVKMGFTSEMSLLILIFSISLIIILTPIFGKIHDSYDPKKAHRHYSFAVAIAAPILFYYAASGDVVQTTISIVLFSILTALISSTIFSILVDKFPFGVRYSGVSLAFNLSVTIFSSSTPVILIFIENYFKKNYLIGFYISFLTILSIITNFILQKKLALNHFNTFNNEKRIYKSIQLSKQKI